MEDVQPGDILIRYHERGGMKRFTIQGAQDSHLRALAIGLWAALPEDHRTDLLLELTHYHDGWNDPGVFLPGLSQAIVQVFHGEGEVKGLIDLKQAREAEHGGSDGGV